MTVNDRQEPAAAALKPSTVALLEDLHSRRETEITNRKNARGYWIISHPRVRSVKDYNRIAKFPRGGKAARRIARGMVERLVGEARRYSDADYQEARRSLYHRRGSR